MRRRRHRRRAAPTAAVPTAPPAVVEPPPFAAPPPATPESAADARSKLRRAILDAAWTTVRDKHYDKTLGGLDWSAVRAKYEPLAIAAPSEAAFYRLLNQMIGELGQSHMMITGPGAEDEVADDETAKPGEAPSVAPSDTSSTAAPESALGGPVGDPGLTVRIIEGRPTITRVRPGSSAEKLGLTPGLIVTQIAGRPLSAPHNSTRALRPVEERFELRRAAALRLAGLAGTRVTVSYLDEHDRPAKAVLTRDPPRGQALQLGLLPPIYPEVRAYEIGDVGVIAFNIFFLDPVLADIKKAMARFQEHHVRAIVLDLRGNPGGQGAMSIPVASLFVAGPVKLGTLTFRTLAQTFDARPELGAKPFLGPLAILTDEGTASTSEMFAAGLQEAKRAVVVGDTTLGAVLPSVVEALAGRRGHAVRGRRLQDAQGGPWSRDAACSPTGGWSRPARRCAPAAIRSLTPPSSPSEHRAAHDHENADFDPPPRRDRSRLRGRLRGQANAVTRHRADRGGSCAAGRSHARRHPGRRRRGDRRSGRLERPQDGAHQADGQSAGDGHGRPRRALPDQRQQVADRHHAPRRRRHPRGGEREGDVVAGSGQRAAASGRGGGRAGAHRGGLEHRSRGAELFTKIETATDPPAGLECLTMTPQELGAAIRDCYDRQTHLQVSQEGTRATPQGDVPFHATVRTGVRWADVKMPYVSETQAGPITVVTTINEVVFDEPIDDNMFEPPAPGAP